MLEEKEQPFKLERVSIRLVKDAPIYSKEPVKTPKQAIELLGEELCEMDREFMCVINLKTSSVPINFSIVSMGTLNASLVEAREVYKSSILSNAASILVVHNHPSGQLFPSESDIQLTAKLKLAGDLIGIPVLDHIIVGGDNSQYFSFAEHNIMPTLTFKKAVEQLEKDVADIKQMPMAAERGRSR